MIPYKKEGLTPDEVAASRAAHGDNVITPARSDSAWRLLADKFRDPIILILLVAAAVSLAVACVEGDFTETIGIVCAIVLATCVGFLFEWDAMRRFRLLNTVNDDVEVTVRRGGAMCRIRAARWWWATWSTSRTAARCRPTASWWRPSR